ncbi:MAG TPA: bifunctional DNA primase/polymerase [Rhodanobacter sp.]|nr:bifunctional DNA primase/polymerase [Rhodanobacter sp.]
MFGRQGVPVVPTRPDAPSMPMVTKPNRIGLRATRTLLHDPRYSSANAAVWLGPRARLTVVDVDSPDPKHLEASIAVFGDSPLKVQTPSRGWHLYFRHAGEGRRIKPIPGLPTDVLGTGIVVVPPSERPAGKKSAGDYRVIQGDLSALETLPEIRSGSMPTARNPRPESDLESCEAFAGMREGDGRDNALFKRARELAAVHSTESDLVRALLAENATFAEPLPIEVVLSKAARAWSYKARGTLMAQGSRAAMVGLDDLARCGSNHEALALLVLLRSHHSLEHVFAVVPEGVAPLLSCSARTAWSAREFLVEAGYLELISRGGRGGRVDKANQYRLRPPSLTMQDLHGIELTPCSSASVLSATHCDSESE